MSSLKNAILTTLLTGALGVGAGLVLPKLASGAVQLPSIQPAAPIVQPAQQSQAGQPSGDQNPVVDAPLSPLTPPVLTELVQSEALQAGAPDSRALAVTEPQAGQYPDDNPGYIAPTIPANMPPPLTELVGAPEGGAGYNQPVCIAVKRLAIFYGAGDSSGANQTATGAAVDPGQALVVAAQPAGGWQPVILGGNLYFVWALDCVRPQ